VTLTVTSNSQLQVSPSSLVFDYQAGGAIPHTQYVSVASTGSSIPFTVGVQGSAGVSAKTVAGNTPSGFGITARPPSTRAPGTYFATATLTPSSGGSTPVNVEVSILVLNCVNTYLY
jgi:hypothetical protein